jgi:hypothetical protein
MEKVQNAGDPEAEASEAILQAPVPQPNAQKSASVVDNSVKVSQIPNPYINSKPTSSNSPVPEQIEDNSVLDNLVSHCLGELPGDSSLNSEKASEIASEAVASVKVVSESPQQ